MMPKNTVSKRTRELVKDMVPIIHAYAMKLYNKLNDDEKEQLDDETWKFPKCLLNALDISNVIQIELGFQTDTKLVNKLKRINKRP